MSLVSFIIPAHDEEEELPGTLAAIRAAAIANGLEYEIVVADDASTDRTAELAEAGGARVVRHERRQIAATRNVGARESRGEFLFFVDADTHVNGQAVSEALEAMKRGAAGGGGPIRFDEPVPLYARIILPISLAFFRWFRFSGGAFFFCTRSVFDATGGWDESLYASEEMTMARAIKQQGRFVVVRTPVLTSGRKLRTYSGREMLALCWSAMKSGGGFVRDRKSLELWYGERRPDRRDGQSP